MNAHEFLKNVSPNDDFGVREKLQKHRMRGLVESIMEKYAEHKINEIQN